MTTRPCPICGVSITSPRARYCSDACKQRAYRLRLGPPPPVDIAELDVELKRRGDRGGHMVYECSSCEARYLGEQRCADCNRFCRVVGLGGACPHCDEPVAVADLLEQ